MCAAWRTRWASLLAAVHILPACDGLRLVHLELKPRFRWPTSKGKQEMRWRHRMPHPRTLLPELPAVTADAVSVGRLRNGAAVNLPEFSAASTVKIFEGQRNLIAIGRTNRGDAVSAVRCAGIVIYGEAAGATARRSALPVDCLSPLHECRLPAWSRERHRRS